MQQGKVVSIHITPTETQPLISVKEVHALAGKGLEGDRYFYQVGLTQEMLRKQ